MKILFIEDDKDKIDAVVDYVHSLNINAKFEIRKSLQSGLEEIINNQEYDLILLDMALPNYDITASEPDGGSPESFAGRDILSQLKLRKISTKALVITQFDTFGDDNITLDELMEQLKNTYPDNYSGCVSFSLTSDKWKKNLKEWLEKFSNRK